MDLRIDNLRFRYCVDVEYDEERPGNSLLSEDGHCGCDICRCGIIYNERVEPIGGNDFFQIVEQIKNQTKVKNTKTKRWNKYFDKSVSTEKEALQRQIDLYCLERLCVHHGLHKPESYEVISSPGYYGEEIDNVELINENQLKSDIIEMLNKDTNLEKVKFVLEKEYLYLLDEIKNADGVEIETFNIHSLARNNVELNRIKNNESRYIYLVDDEKMIMGITYAGKIIDGHNRTKDAIMNNLQQGQYICLYDD